MEHQKSRTRAGGAECAEIFTEPESKRDNCSQGFLSLPLQQILRKSKAKNCLISLHKRCPMTVGGQGLISIKGLVGRGKGQ